MQESSEAVTVVKILMLGDSAIGKSHIVSRFVFGSFEPGEREELNEFQSRSISVEGKSVRVQIWEPSADSKNIKALPRVLFRMADAFALCFDPEIAQSFEHLARYASFLEDHADSNSLTMVLAIDRNLKGEKAVSEETSKAFAEERGFLTGRADAMAEQGADEAFFAIAKEVLKRKKEGDPEKRSVTSDATDLMSRRDKKDIFDLQVACCKS